MHCFRQGRPPKGNERSLSDYLPPVADHEIPGWLAKGHIPGRH